MPHHAGAQADPALDVAPEIRHTVPWRVASVTALPDFRLRVEFVDGTLGEVDLRAFLSRPAETLGVFAPLRDPAVFAQALIVLGAVEWPGGPDLAPDAMYDAIREHGCWLIE